jgi:hypothetical protein
MRKFALVEIASGDGFHETVDFDLIASDERIVLCYDWDGMELPIDHGFPLRIWLPDRYEMKKPKWIIRMEITGDYKEGYWVRRGWDEVAQVNAVSVIDTVAADSAYEKRGESLVPIGGMAFAGARGISRVEPRVDKGEWLRGQPSGTPVRDHLGHLTLRLAVRGRQAQFRRALRGWERYAADRARTRQPAERRDRCPSKERPALTSHGAR